MEKADCKVGMRVKYTGPSTNEKGEIFTVTYLYVYGCKVEGHHGFYPRYENLEQVKEEPMNKDKLRQELKEVEAKVVQIRLELDKPEEPMKALHLEIPDSNLRIMYGKEEIGYITTAGRCHILNTLDKVSPHKDWMESDGKPIDESKIWWRGKEYYITEDGVLGGVTAYSSIYNFIRCKYIPNSTDTNIQRFHHNNRPIGF